VASQTAKTIPVFSYFSDVYMGLDYGIWYIYMVDALIAVLVVLFNGQ
jgi:hypothetical protein